MIKPRTLARGMIHIGKGCGVSVESNIDGVLFPYCRSRFKEKMGHMVITPAKNDIVRIVQDDLPFDKMAVFCYVLFEPLIGGLSESTALIQVYITEWLC